MPKKLFPPYQVFEHLNFSPFQGSIELLGGSIWSTVNGWEVENSALLFSRFLILEKGLVFFLGGGFDNLSYRHLHRASTLIVAVLLRLSRTIRRVRYISPIIFLGLGLSALKRAGTRQKARSEWMQSCDQVRHPWSGVDNRRALAGELAV